MEKVEKGLGRGRRDGEGEKEWRRLRGGEAREEGMAQIRMG